MSIFRKLSKIIADILDNDDDITKDSYLEDDLGLDSMQMTELLMCIEEEFEVEIEEEAVSDFETVDDLINYIEDRI